MSIAQKILTPRAWAELLCLGLIWGTVFLATRLALNEVGVLTSVAHRTFWAALILWGVVWLRGLPVPRGWRVWIGFLGMGLLNNIIPFTLLNWSQLHLQSGVVSILNGTTAVFAILVAALFLADERLSAGKLIGAIIGLSGIVLVIGPDQLTQVSLRSVAQWAALIATLSYAFAGIWARKWLAELPAETAAAGMVTMSALIAVPTAWVMEGPLTFSLAPLTLFALAWYAIVCTALAYLLFYRVLAVAGSGNVMLVTLLIPPVAISLGAMVLNETLPSTALFGFALLAFGLLVIDGRLLRLWHSNGV